MIVFRFYGGKGTKNSKYGGKKWGFFYAQKLKGMLCVKYCNI